jgi:hypothetical protein
VFVKPLADASELLQRHVPGVQPAKGGGDKILTSTKAAKVL